MSEPSSNGIVKYLAVAKTLNETYFASEWQNGTFHHTKDSIYAKEFDTIDQAEKAISRVHFPRWFECFVVEATKLMTVVKQCD